MGNAVDSIFTNLGITQSPESLFVQLVRAYNTAGKPSRDAVLPHLRLVSGWTEGRHDTYVCPLIPMLQNHFGMTLNEAWNVSEALLNCVPGLQTKGSLSISAFLRALAWQNEQDLTFLYQMLSKRHTVFMPRIRLVQMQLLMQNPLVQERQACLVGALTIFMESRARHQQVCRAARIMVDALNAGGSFIPS